MADKNEYGWGWSRNLPILIILLIISGFLIANVITFNNISVAPEDPNQAITKSRASYLYWFNLIILLFVITIIILLIMFMYRNKNTPYVDYFGKNINIIDTTTGKNIKDPRNLSKTKPAANAIVAGLVPGAAPAGPVVPPVTYSNIVGDFDCVDAGITNTNTCDVIKNSINSSDQICNRKGVTDVGTCYDDYYKGLGFPKVDRVPARPAPPAGPVVPPAPPAGPVVPPVTYSNIVGDFDCVDAGITNTNTCDVIKNSINSSDQICNRKGVTDVGTCYDDYYKPLGFPKVDRVPARPAPPAAPVVPLFTEADCDASGIRSVTAGSFTCNNILTSLTTDLPTGDSCKQVGITNVNDCYNYLYEPIR